jgi:hypothetical protein
MDYSIVFSIITRLEAEQKVLESQVLRTPTGANRDYLTEVNIHLIEAIDALRMVEMEPLKVK